MAAPLLPLALSKSGTCRSHAGLLNKTQYHQQNLADRCDHFSTEFSGMQVTTKQHACMHGRQPSRPGHSFTIMNRLVPGKHKLDEVAARQARAWQCHMPAEGPHLSSLSDVPPVAAAKLSCARLLTEASPLVWRVLGRARAWVRESSSCSISGSSASESSSAVAGRSLTTCNRRLILPGTLTRTLQQLPTSSELLLCGCMPRPAEVQWWRTGHRIIKHASSGRRIHLDCLCLRTLTSARGASSSWALRACRWMPMRSARAT